MTNRRRSNTWISGAAWLLALFLLLLAACTAVGLESKEDEIMPKASHLPPNPNLAVDYSRTELSQIVLAGGCFWGTQAFLARVPGVAFTEVVYANGDEALGKVSYEQVCRGDTGFAEAVRVRYDAARLPLSDLLGWFFQTIDPTLRNRQGNDVGSQYRTGIYYVAEADRSVIENFLEQEARKYSRPLVTEVAPLGALVVAEEYHQDYLEKNPGGYCHVSFEPLLEAETKPTFERYDEATLKLELSSLAYDVTQKGATERAYTSPYDALFEPGIYVDVTSGQPLFVSSDKFDSGCGWPSFSQPIDEELLVEIEDRSYGMLRTEVRSLVGDAHLGHVFNNGPLDQGGLRYCINGAALRFIPQDEMAAEGYAAWLYLFAEEETD